MSTNTELTRFRAGESFATSMVLGFLTPEDRASVAGVNRRWKLRSTEPGISAIGGLALQELKLFGDLLGEWELAHRVIADLQSAQERHRMEPRRKPAAQPLPSSAAAPNSALANAEPSQAVVDLDAAQQRYKQTLQGARARYTTFRQRENIRQVMGDATYLRAEAGDEGYSIHPLSALNQGDFWTRMKNKIRYYSGYEHACVARRLAGMPAPWWIPLLPAFNYEISNLHKFRAQLVQYSFASHRMDHLWAALTKNQENLASATRQLNCLAMVVWLVVQQVIHWWKASPSMRAVNSTTQQACGGRMMFYSFLEQGQGRIAPTQANLLPQGDKSLHVLAVPVCHKYNNVYRSSDRLSGGVRLMLSQDGTTPLASCVIQRVWTCGDGVVYEGNFDAARHGRRLVDRRLQFRMEEPIPQDLRRRLFQLVAEVFEREGEQVLEGHGVRIRKEKGGPKVLVMIEGDRATEWSELLITARMNPLLSGSGSVLPSFFERDLSRNAMPDFESHAARTPSEVPI